MTRLIESKKKTQVNSNLIGVRVIPDEFDNVTGITVRYTYKESTLVDCVYGPDKNGEYRPAEDGHPCYLYKQVIDGEDPDNWPYIVLFEYGSETDTDGNEYTVLNSVPTVSPVVWCANGHPDELYNLTWDEELQGYVATRLVDEGFVYVKSFTTNKTLCWIATNEFIDSDGVVYNRLDVLNSGITVVDNNSDDNIGLFSGYANKIGNYTFTKTTTSDVYNGTIYYYWDGEGCGYPVYDNVRTGVGTTVKWDSIKVNDNVFFRLYNSGYNIKKVLSVNTEHIVDPINCKFSYSVDGETWTDWEENLTDANNVIANIPRYMFLKFGQDVEITEE